MAVVLALAGYFLTPWVATALNTVSTDDAYVNGHVTFVAPRVLGQVSNVLVDDNYRVTKGELLVELDSEPYRVQVAIKKAAVETAEADLAAAQAQVRGQVAQARANRYKLEHAIEEVDNQIANLRAAVATLNSRNATLELARANLMRGEGLFPSRAISQEDLDALRETYKVAEAGVEQALQAIYAIRVSLGLPAKPAAGDDLAQVPPDLDQNFSTVRQALGELLQSAAQFGYSPDLVDRRRRKAGHRELLQARPAREISIAFYARLIPQAPAIKQAEAKLLQARRDLDQAELNLRYCTHRQRNRRRGDQPQRQSRQQRPGGAKPDGRPLAHAKSGSTPTSRKPSWPTCASASGCAARWTCTAGGSEFEGRITGFTMGTGETLSLLPPQNATGNFVKIVQRLPVRIELTDYDPDKDPLFVGLSVTPYVYYKEPPSGAACRDVPAVVGPAGRSVRPLQTARSETVCPAWRHGR